MNTLPKIYSYGEYNGNGNYGAHCLAVRFHNGFELFYSYETIVAFIGRDGRKVRQNDWSTTTGKHLNWIDGGNKKARLTGEEFEKLLNAELEHYNLIEEKCKFCGEDLYGRIRVHHHTEMVGGVETDVTK